MIVRVDIENLVIVERAEFAPGSGLTAVTGETGAGKTLLATAIGLLFGGDADAGQVGPAGQQAWVEGEFEADERFWSHPDVATLAELRPEPDAPLVLARRVDANGRSRAMAWGRTVAKSDLAAAGSLLVATAGQHVQVRLRSADYQRETLDGGAGSDHQALRSDMAATWQAYAAARADLERVQQLVAESGNRADVVRDDLARIDAVAPSLEEEAELVTSRDRVRHHAGLVEALATAASLLDGSDAGNGGAIDIAGRAYAELDRAVALDPQLGELAGTLLAAQETLTDAASSIASRLGDLESGPGSIDEIEDRLAAYDELKRRFGGTTESVLATWEALREQVTAIDDSSGLLAQAQSALDATLAAATRAAELLTASRCALADTLSADIRGSL
ncbi:MAG: recN, partial [Thermoleophilia bacterium]|nr:recN [Thermoleophilia bacterium]